jgi:hypothetical protein
MANATANATSTPLGGTGSAAQAGAMGSSGGTTTGTVACSSCCAPQGRFLISIFGGYGEAGLCPGAIDNSQPFNIYATYVLSLNFPNTPSQFCLNSSFTLTGIANGYYSAFFLPPSASCNVISPPATSNVLSPNSVYTYFFYTAGVNLVNDLKILCGCSSPQIYLNTFGTANFALVSCSPPVFTYSCYVLNSATGLVIGTAAVTVTF